MSQDSFTAKAALDSILAKLNSTAKDVAKFDNGNNSAGTRLRKVFAEVREELQATRFDIQATKNERTKK